jgi:hypothetical protein
MGNANDFYIAIGLDPKTMAGLYPVLEQILADNNE